MRSSNLRIGIDATNIRHGGAVTHLIGLLSEFEFDKHQIAEIVVWSGDYTLRQISPRQCLRLERAEEAFQSVKVRRQWQKHVLPDLLRKNVDALFVPGGVYTGRAVPFVTMAQNQLPFDRVEQRRFGWSKTHLRYLALRHLQRKTFRRSSGVIFLTEASRRAILENIGPLPCPTAVVPHGVGTRFTNAKRMIRSNADIDAVPPFRWLYVSIINFYKHQWLVVEAAAELRRQGYAIELDLVGGAYPAALGKLKACIQRLDPAEEFIHYRGEIPYEEVDQVYLDADASIFASSCETFGQILIEAMQSGLPVASSDKLGMPEIVGAAGVYFDPLSVESIVAAMKRVMDDDDLRRKMSQLGLARAAEFTWERCADETFAFIRQCLGS